MGGGGVKNYQKLRDVIYGRPHTDEKENMDKIRYFLTKKKHNLQFKVI